MTNQLSEDDTILNDIMLQTNEGKLLHHFGFVPVNTEASARFLTEKMVVLLKDIRSLAEVVDGPRLICEKINTIINPTS
jgi:hypothetical protein